MWWALINFMFIDPLSLSLSLSSSPLLLLPYCLKIIENKYLIFGQKLNKKILKNVETSSTPLYFWHLLEFFFSFLKSWLMISSYFCTIVNFVLGNLQK